jgi:replicative DNA helicase
MRGGQLIVVAGGTSSGKTSLATNIAMNVARRATPAAFFTLEMSADDIGVRLLASETGISTADICADACLKTN